MDLGQENLSPSWSPCCPTSRRAHKHDSGWAWVVGTTGSLCTVLAIGCSYSFGVIYPSLLDGFNQGKAKTGKAALISVSFSHAMHACMSNASLRDLAEVTQVVLWRMFAPQEQFSPTY